MDQHGIGELHELISAQTAVIAELRQRIEQLEARPEPTAASAEGPAGTALTIAEIEEHTSRRGFLRLAGVAAAGAAAVVAGSALPAAAANGQAIAQGADNSGTLETIVRNTANAGAAVDISTLKGVGGSNSVGLWGEANGPAGAGVEGRSDSGYGVIGVGVEGYSIFADGVSRFGMGQHLAGTGSPTTGGYALGDFFRNGNGDLWLCVVSSTPGPAKFRKLGGPETAGQFHLLPVAKRCYDSRSGQAPLNVLKGQLVANGTRAGIDTKNGTGVPAGAVGVLMNVTVTSTTGSGWVTLFAFGSAYPGTANVNWAAGGSTVGSMAMVPCDANGLISVFAANATDIILDVAGYYL